MSAAGDRVYRLLLRAFPVSFRRRYAADMTAQFAAERALLRGRPFELAALWYRAAVDALRHGAALRRDRDARRQPRRAAVVLGDLRYAARSLRRHPGITAVIVTTLTAGISATTIMFGVVDRLLLSAPGGVGHPESVRRVHFGMERPRPGSRVSDRHSYPAVAGIRDGTPSFATAAATTVASVTLGAGAEARTARAQLVDDEYFPLLELRPFAGRFPGEPRGAEPVVVLSHSYWRRVFDSDLNVLGRHIEIDGVPLSISGIAPVEFKGVEDDPIDLWAPIGALAPAWLGAKWASNPGRFAFHLLARLQPGVSPATADRHATQALRAVTAGMPTMPDDVVAMTAPLHRLEAPNGIRAEGKVALWLLSVAAIVLVVAITNVASLLLTRAWSRRREIAVRVALGVSRSRLLKQELLESALLAAIAATCTIGVTWLGSQFVQTVLLPQFAWPDGVVDGRLLMVAVGVASLTALATGVVPAMSAMRVDPLPALRTSPQLATGRAGRLRAVLLAGQVALCVILLVGAGLFVKSLVTLERADVGIDLDRVVRVAIPERAGESSASARTVYDQARAQIAALPGVDRVSVVHASAPVSGAQGVTTLRDGWTLRDLNGRGSPTYSIADLDYFATLGTSLERGRAFTADDERGRALVTVITRALADAFWPGDDAVGQCLRISGESAPCTRVIGIVENVLLFRRDENTDQQLFLLTSHPFASGTRPRALMVRTGRDVAALLPEIRRRVQALRPDMRFVDVDTLAAKTAPQLQPWRLGATMFLLFGAVALAIAAVGLFSAMAYAVAQRHHEIGIRMALGAPAWRVAGQVARQGLAVVVVGAVVGLAGAALLSGQVADLLYATSPRDPGVFAMVAAVLALAGVLAALVPARRSFRIDPLVVLKSD